MQRRRYVSRAREVRDRAVGLGLVSFGALILCGMVMIGLTGPTFTTAHTTSGYGVTGDILSIERRAIVR